MGQQSAVAKDVYAINNKYCCDDQNTATCILTYSMVITLIS